MISISLCTIFFVLLHTSVKNRQFIPIAVKYRKIRKNVKFFSDCGIYHDICLTFVSLVWYNKGTSDVRHLSPDIVSG